MTVLTDLGPDECSARLFSLPDNYQRAQTCPPKSGYFALASLAAVTKSVAQAN